MTVASLRHPCIKKHGAPKHCSLQHDTEEWASLQHALTFLDAKELVIVYSIYQKRHEQVPECLSSPCNHCLLIRPESGKRKLDDHALQIWESEFAWTEADKPIKLAARALTVPKGSSLNQQPMFCFETMMAMWYWSCLVYDYQRVRLSA